MGFLIFITPYSEKEFVGFFYFLLSFKKMEKFNLFEECFNSKKSNVKVKTLQAYSKKCEKITWWCDELKLISKGDYLSNCPCFQQIVYNWTNSKDVSLDVNQFQNCVFDNITITLDVFQSCLLYKVVVNYEWNIYDLIDFRFYTLDSQKAKVNWYLSDILIHWKARRLQVVSGWKFNIYDFITDLVCYSVKQKDRYLIALEEYYITRFDFRIDFFHNNDVKHLKYEDVYTANARKWIDNLVIDRKSKKIYTWRTAWNRKDKYVYTRMYQKQVEALDKWHWELYFDYIDYPWKVRRLEFEFLSKFTTARKNISLSDEFIHHELSKQIFEYIGVSEKHWFFSKPKNKIEIPFNKLSIHKQKRIITQFKNNSIRLHKAWINPYTIVNQAFYEYELSFDRQVIEHFFECSLFSDRYEDIMKDIESSKITSEEIYNRIYKNQLWIDL